MFWPFEFRVGLLPWPFACGPPVPAHTHDIIHAVTGRLWARDFKDGMVSLSLMRGEDGRLQLRTAPGGCQLGSGAHPIVESDSDTYGAYIAHDHDRYVKYILAGDCAVASDLRPYQTRPAQRDFRLLASRCPPTVSYGQFFRTKPATSTIRCKVYDAPPRRGNYVSTLPVDFVFGPVQEVMSAYGCVSVRVDGFWINVWKQGTHYAIAL